MPILSMNKAIDYEGNQPSYGWIIGLSQRIDKSIKNWMQKYNPR